MRTLVSLVSLSLVAGTALAQRPPAAPAPTAPAAVRPPPPSPAVNLTPVDERELPAACRPLARRTRTADVDAALTSRIALASCLAKERISALSLCDCGESVVQIDEATTRSFELLDEVAAAGTTRLAVIAHHAKAELYTAMRVRMMSTLPAPGGTSAAAALHDGRKAILVALLEPWQERAAAADAKVVELAQENPRLARDPVIKGILAGSRQRLQSAPQLARSDEPSEDDDAAKQPDRDTSQGAPGSSN